MRFPLIDIRSTGQNIERLVKERQLSIRTLQTYFGFDTPRAIYKWLRGEHLPSVDHLFALSKLLRVPIQDILIEQTKDDQDVPPIMRKKLKDYLLVYLHNCRSDAPFHPFCKMNSLLIYLPSSIETVLCKCKGLFLHSVPYSISFFGQPRAAFTAPMIS